MEQRPMVTVIMSSYNHEKYVGEAIESVLNQKYDNFEFLIADDGSTDGSAEIIKQYQDDRIKFFEFKQNTGFKTWDVMRENASGKYIACIGSDDVWHKDKLEKQVTFLEQHEEYAACFTWLETINGESEVILDEVASRNAYFNIENRSSEEWMKKFFYVGSGLAAPSFMMRTDVYKDMGGFHFKYRQIQDYELWIRYIQHHKLYVIPEKLLFYRWHMEDETINISAPSKDGMTRTANEICYMYGNIIEMMEDDFFVRTFKDNLVRKDCVKHEEIMCEKFLILLNHPKIEAQQCGINYYLKHIDEEDFKECLESVYNFSRADFHTMEANRGIVQKMYDLELMVEEYKALLNRAIGYMESMKK